MRKFMYLFLAVTLLACGVDDDPKSTTNTMDIQIGYVTNYEAGIN